MSLRKEKIKQFYEELITLNGEELRELLAMIPLLARTSLVTLGIQSIHDEMFEIENANNKIH